MIRGDHVESSYLGFGLSIQQARITVTTPDGRPLGRVRTLPAMRKLVKSYRNSTAPGRVSLDGNATRSKGGQS